MFEPGCKRIVLGDLLKDFEQYAETLHKARTSKQPIGPRTNIREFDEELCGAFSPGLHAITGDTGAGKTAFALQTACTCGTPALYISCEMHPMELLRRIIARTSRTFLGKLKTGELPVSKLMTLAHAACVSAPLLAIGDATSAYADPQWIYEQAMLTKDDADHVLVVIDSLHSWVDSENCPLTEYERINKGLTTLRALASELNAPVLYIAERNRASKQQGGTSSGAGSRKIEYGAETQIDLNRMGEESASAGSSHLVVARFAKNRNGAPGKTINLWFNGALQEFKGESHAE